MAVSLLQPAKRSETLSLFSEIPQERTLHYSLRRPSVYDPMLKVLRDSLTRIFKPA